MKYEYAFDSRGGLYHISELDETNKYQKWYCVGCSAELIPKMGKIKEHHFAHKIENTCNPETYLHSTAKTMLFDLYMDCLEMGMPFYLHYPVSRWCDECKDIIGKECFLGNESDKMDLTTRFRRIYLEKKVDSFIPDLYIADEDGNKIFFEIAISHNCEKKKIDSGYRIIELRMNNESGFQLFLNKEIDYRKHGVRMYNFKKNEVCVHEMINCDKDFWFGILFKDKRTYITKRRPSHFKKLVHSNSIIHKYYLLESSEYFDAHMEIADIGYTEDPAYKNCLLCKYSYVNTFKGFCKCNIVKDYPLAFTEALYCVFFVPKS